MTTQVVVISRVARQIAVWLCLISQAARQITTRTSYILYVLSHLQLHCHGHNQHILYYRSTVINDIMGNQSLSIVSNNQCVTISLSKWQCRYV